MDDEFSEKKTFGRQKEATDEDVYCTIRKDEVPPVPSNNFLMRQMNEETSEARTNRAEVDDRSRSRRGEENNRPTDALGRKVKGRGALVSYDHFLLEQSQSNKETVNGKFLSYELNQVYKR